MKENDVRIFVVVFLMKWLLQLLSVRGKCLCVDVRTFLKRSKRKDGKAKGQVGKAAHETLRFFSARTSR